MTPYQQDRLRCEAIVRAMPNRGTVTDPYLLSVLRHHRNWRDRPGQTIRKVILTDKCTLLHIRAPDGSYVDTIGLLSALADKHQRKRRSDVPGYFQKQAFREAIYPQVRSARGFKSNRTHEIDHSQHTFQELLDMFLHKVGVRLLDVKTRRKPGSMWCQLVDKDLERRWQDFHAKHAHLEAITIAEHKRRTAQRRN